MAEFSRPEVVVNAYRKSAPLNARILEKHTLVDKGPGTEVYHITLDAPDYTFREGQSVGVLPPGVNERGKRLPVRLYSVASLGNDEYDVPPLALCVKRVVLENDEEETATYGVASNYLASLSEGDDLEITGPAGRKFLLPVNEELDRPYLFLATGTGIAPFRGMLERLRRTLPGLAHPVYLFMGVRHADELLYHDEFMQIPLSNFHYIAALSREEVNPYGGRMYVHHKMLAYEKEMLEVLQNDRALIYICGLKGMEEGIENLLHEWVLEKKIPYTWEHLHARILKEVY